MTRTYAILELSKEAFEEIETKLRTANYEHAFQARNGKLVIDMHGIAVQEIK
jgi:hypothetical protein